jgi:hypothetical protein
MLEYRVTKWEDMLEYSYKIGRYVRIQSYKIGR